VSLDVEPGLVIPEFTGDYAFLSMFYQCTIKSPDGWLWPSGEHLFHACKCRTARDRQRIQAAPTPRLAKRVGRQVTLRPDWEQAKKSVMLRVNLLKFEQNTDLRALLDATRGYELVEGNAWNDDYWGRVNGQGANHLGRILMYVREVFHDDS
jgi:ribA/ribD-fused uncharacterized protein